MRLGWMGGVRSLEYGGEVNIPCRLAGLLLNTLNEWRMMNIGALPQPKKEEGKMRGKSGEGSVQYIAA